MDLCDYTLVADRKNWELKMRVSGDGQDSDFNPSIPGDRSSCLALEVVPAGVPATTSNAHTTFIVASAGACLAG